MSNYPLVQRDDSSAAFFDAAERGQLQLGCSKSGAVFAPQVARDPEDPSAELRPVTAAGSGTVISWAVVHRSPHPALTDAVPYISAVVELTEGPWLVVRLLGDPEHLHVGAAVQVRFVRTGLEPDCGEMVPVFELVTSRSAE